MLRGSSRPEPQATANGVTVSDYRAFLESNRYDGRTRVR
jgi:hypothetical protein